MSWESELFAMLDDLEGRAEAVFDADRVLEVADRARGEYAAVTSASRLMASVGNTLTLGVVGVGSLRGRLATVGDGWCLLESDQQEWLVRHDAVATVLGASPRSVPRDAWPVTARLGWASTLRGIAEWADPCRLLLRDGSRFDVVAMRVGQDFLEVAVGERREPMLVDFAAMAAVRTRR
ncbi:hypothetical protein ASG90_14360 [Nocardioides sp. Soil797]|nr:hypothetical protein ASG90_14360 [Nocardioides sp. Soil797]